MYQRVVRYALQTCVRPTESSDALPATVAADVNIVMSKIRSEMGKELAKECERLNGVWYDAPWEELSKRYPNYKLLENYEKETSANSKWGSCVNPTTTTLMSAP